MKKLSIITICYNIKDEIERTCESIVNQTWKDFEWIVVDGGSTDGTVDVLNKYKKHMTVFISEPDKGVYNAMNKGIKLAKGEWLNFMNGGDCFAENDVLEKVFKDKKYEADILYANLYLLDKGLKQNKTYPKRIDKNHFYNGNICHQSSFIKRELFDEFGLYDETYKICADYEKWVIYASNNKKFQYLDIFSSIFYLGGISANHRKMMEERNNIKSKYYSKGYIFLKIFGIPILKIENK